MSKNLIDLVTEMRSGEFITETVPVSASSRPHRSCNIGFFQHQKCLLLRTFVHTGRGHGKRQLRTLISGLRQGGREGGGGREKGWRRDGEREGGQIFH